MATHAPDVVETDDPRTAMWRRLNYFPTPPWAARAGGELITALDPEARSAWEPACGQGHMAYGLSDYFAEVMASDIVDHATGTVSGALKWPDCLVDFLDAESPFENRYDWIVTNPPFSAAQQFVELGLKRARRGVAMLCRTAWWDTEGRFDLFFGQPGCDVKAAFFDRVPMSLGGWDPGGSTATAYAWFIWFKDAARPAWLTQAKAAIRGGGPSGFGLGPIDIGIPPGTNRRLSLPVDAALFGRRATAPLFEGVDHA